MSDAASTSTETLESVLDTAVAASRALADTSLEQRAERLERVADALDAASEVLVPLAIEESRLGEQRLTGELRRTTFQLRLFARVVREGAYLQATIDHADDAWGMGPRPDLRRMLRPLGPVAVFAASNFPFAFSVAGGDTATALAAGAPVVVKAHPGHPRLSRATEVVVTAALAEAGAPVGTFALVEGFDVGPALVADPRITAASFTGSVAGGRALFDLAVRRPIPIPFFGELGSVNPAFVTRAAAARDPAAIATGFVGSMTLGVGQFCTKPGVLVIPVGSGIAERIAAAIADVAAAPMLNDAILGGFERSLDELAEHPDVDVLVRGGEHADGVTASVLRTTVAALLADPAALTEERFGPAALVVEYDDESDLLAAAAVFEGQLTATVHGVDDDAVAPAVLALLAERAGRVLWNGWPTGVSVTDAMQHGGPYPATTSVQSTSVGTSAIDRFLRPVSYQNLPQALLPEAVRDENPWRVPQRIDGVLVLARD